MIAFIFIHKFSSISYDHAFSFYSIFAFSGLFEYNQMDKSAEKKTIMDYLPEHERAKLRKLVQRLAE